MTRHRPDSTMAKPACMNITRKPHSSVHTKLMAILFWPARLARSPMLRPVFESETGTSVIVPVTVPPGSPACNAAAGGALPAASFSSAVVADCACATTGIAVIASVHRKRLAKQLRASFMEYAPVFVGFAVVVVTAGGVITFSRLRSCCTPRVGPR